MMITLSFGLLAGFGTATAAVLLGWLLVSFAQLRRVNRELERRSEEAQRTTEAKSTFVANLSHELRTPLHAVIGFSELLQAGRSGPVSSAQHEQLGIIRGSADHLLTLINEVLDLAQVETGHLRLEPEPIEPAAIVRECIDSTAPLAARHGIEVEFDPVPVGTVRLDPGRLRQIVLNYLSNALKFAGAGRRVTVAVTRDRAGVLLEVSDTGPGIALVDQERVFEEFVQLDQGCERGTGLGLAVTKRIVQAQGGRVGVRSRPGAGATFYAWLPVDAERSRSPQDAARRRPRPTEPVPAACPTLARY